MPLFLSISKSQWKKIAWIALIFSVLLMGLVGACTYWVQTSSRPFVIEDLNHLPNNEIGLVLGGGNYLYGSVVNIHFIRRVEAAAALYRNGKVKHLLLSGNDILPNSHEPSEMKLALIALRVPESAITLDQKSLRTLDSIVRAKEIFGYSTFTIITERSHSFRAVFLSRFYNLKTVGFAAEDLPWRKAFRTHLHEWLGNVKAVMDLYLLKTQPAFLER